MPTSYLLPGQPLQLSDAERTKLGGFLLEMCSQLEGDNKSFFSCLDTWWRWYDGQPAKERRTDPWDGACISRDTEVLTRNGWFRVDELVVGQIVLTRRDDNGALEWKPVLATPRVWADHLYLFSSKSVCQALTPDHQTITVDRFGKNPKRLRAETLWGTTNRRFPMTGTFIGETPTQLFGLDAGDVMELLGWYVSEGWSNKNSDGEPAGTLFIGQSATANPQKCQQIAELLARLGITWTRAKSNECFCLHARSIPPELAKCLRSLGDTANEKHLPTFVFDLSPSLLWRMLDSLILGDGHTNQQPHQNQPVKHYYTSSKRLADDFQRISALVGKHASIHTRDRRGQLSGTGFGPAKFISYELCLRNKKLAKVDAAKQGLIEYRDYAYCVTVDNHSICIRRDGKPSWTGNSNVVIPLVRIYSDAVKSRLYNTMFGGPKLWQVSSKNEAMVPAARAWDQFQNWACDDNDFDIYTPTGMWLDEASVLGDSVIQLDWTIRKRYVFRPGEGGKPTPVPVELGRGPNLTAWPRDQIMWQYGRPISDAEYVFTQSPKTWGDLVTMDQFGDVDPGYIDKCETEGHGATATRRIRKSIEQGAGQDASDQLYDIRQAFVEMPVLRGLKFEELGEQDPSTPTIPLVVTFDRTSGTILRVIGKPYYTKGWNFYEGNVRTTSNHRNPSGIAKMLEPLQRGATQSFNQAIDTVTFANSVAGFTTDRRLTTARFQPGHYQYVESLDAVREAQHGKLVAPDLSLINMMFSLAERLTGINDPSLGREIRYGGHPSPATSTAIMLQESKELLKTTTKHLRLELSRLGEDTATLYQQFESRDSGKITRAIGDEDGAQATSWMVGTDMVYGSLKFDLHALTETVNPDAEREKAIFTMQATGSYYTQLMQLYQVAAHPNTPPPGKAAAIKAVEALTAAFSNVLEAAEVDDIRQYVLQLKDPNLAPGPNNPVAGALNDKLSQLAEASGQSQFPVIPGVPTGAPAPTNGQAPPGGF